MRNELQEHKHIHKHVYQNWNDVKTLDVKILELREQPDNVDLLISILAMIFSEADSLMEKGEEIKDFDIVNYVLAKALKAD